MKRTPMPPRTKPLRRKKAMVRKNKGREADDFKRKWGSQLRKDLICAMPCLLCGRHLADGVDPHHEPPLGSGGNFRGLLPLCRGCHSLRHDRLASAFMRSVLVLEAMRVCDDLETHSEALRKAEGISKPGGEKEKWRTNVGGGTHE